MNENNQFLEIRDIAAYFESEEERRSDALDEMFIAAVKASEAGDRNRARRLSDLLESAMAAADYPAFAAKVDEFEKVKGVG